MKIKHLTNETFTVNENPFATALKKAKAGAEYFTGDDGAIAGAAKQMSKKYGGAHGSKEPIKPGFGSALRKGLGLGPDDGKGKTAKAPKTNTKASAPTVEPKVVKKGSPIKDVGDLPSGSAYQDGKSTWTYTGTEWTDGKNKIDANTGWRKFQKAIQKGQAFVAKN
tara:strand:- start:8210 stop:8707 length:498 start_codon:yes stop_codon:yes gene_type:complete